MKRKFLIAVAVIFFAFVALVIAVFISEAIIKHRVPVSLLSSLSVQGDRNYANATGTMVIEGERSAMPLQVSEIKCSARTRECIVGTALIVNGHGLYISVDTYPVIEWTASHLIFGSNADCVSNTFTLNWATQSGTGIRVKNKNPPQGVDCSMIQHNELRSTLRDGITVHQEEEQRAQPAFIKLIRAFFSMF